MGRQFTTRLTGQKCDRPGADSRVLHQQCLAEGLAARGKQRVADLLDAAIQGLENRDACKQTLPGTQQALAEQIGGKHPRDHHHDGGDHEPGARDHGTQPVLRSPIERNERGHQFIHGIDHATQYPQGDHQRDPDDETGNQIALQHLKVSRVNSRPRRTSAPTVSRCARPAEHTGSRAKIRSMACSI